MFGVLLGPSMFGVQSPLVTSVSTVDELVKAVADTSVEVIGMDDGSYNLSTGNWPPTPTGDVPTYIVVAENRKLTFQKNNASGGAELNGWAQRRILEVQDGAVVTLNGVGIGNGSSTAAGGGAHNAGTLTINGGNIMHSTAATDGGGVSNTGTLTIESAAIQHNIAANAGGGIHNAGTLTFNGGAVQHNDNSNGNGGAINLHDGGSATIKFASIQHNDAAKLGGGIYICKTCALTFIQNVTVQHNTAGNEGGGVENDGGKFTNGTFVDFHNNSPDDFYPPPATMKPLTKKFFA